MSSTTYSSHHLSQQKCVPCEGGTQPFSSEEEANYLTAVPKWTLEKVGVHRLVREVTAPNFAQAVVLFNSIAQIAEAEGHHPNLTLYDYKHLKIELSTHAIGGLSVNDFIVATKIDQVLAQLPWAPPS